MGLDLKDPVLAKLGDFGLSQHVAPYVDSRLETFNWMAPETFSGKNQHDERCDIYSYGIVMWEVADRRSVSSG